MTNNVFVTFRHLRRNLTSTEGGVTLAILVNLSNPDDRHLMFGFALCNPVDNFCKATGRVIAYSDLSARRKFGLADKVPYEDGNIVECILEYMDGDYALEYAPLKRYLKNYVL